MKLFLFALILLPSAVLHSANPAPAASTRLAGAASVDITPDYPVRLSGYGSRREVNQGVAQHIFAKALAIGSDEEGPAVLVTVDNCGVPGAMRDEVLRRLGAKTKVRDERFAIASSHTHCAPMLVGVLPNLFGMDIPAEHLPAIERYTRELTDKIEQVALAALADRKPSQLAWGVGKVGFAANRRGLPPEARRSRSAGAARHAAGWKGARHLHELRLPLHHDRHRQHSRRLGGLRAGGPAARVSGRGGAHGAGLRRGSESESASHDGTRAAVRRSPRRRGETARERRSSRR